MKFLILTTACFLISCGNTPELPKDQSDEEIPVTDQEGGFDETTRVTNDTIFETGIRETQEIPNDSGGVTRIDL